MNSPGETEEVIVIHDMAICYPYSSYTRYLHGRDCIKVGADSICFQSTETEELPVKVITPLFIKEV